MDSVDETRQEEPAAFQFDLFGQDRIKLGDGYASLAKLEAGQGRLDLRRPYQG